MIETRCDIIAADGVNLVGDHYPGDNSASVLFAHGGGQTRHAWKNAAKRLSDQGWSTLTYDLRGHGDSDWAPNGVYRIDDFASDLLTVAQFLPKPVHVVGASLGGISAMIAAGQLDKTAFASVTLVDITPTMQPEGFLKIVGFMSEHLDDGFASLEAAADVIAKYMPHRPKPKDLSGLSKNLRKQSDGRYYWHWDPKFITGMWGAREERRREILVEAVRSISAPMHLIRGRLSELVSEQAAQEFLEAYPDAVCTDVSGAGHMVAGDKNDVFIDALEKFITKAECS
jgi:pimeloyl-ACP methyl ester carboxylesterase